MELQRLVCGMGVKGIFLRLETTLEKPSVTFLLWQNGWQSSAPSGFVWVSSLWRVGPGVVGETWPLEREAAGLVSGWEVKRADCCCSLISLRVLFSDPSLWGAVTAFIVAFIPQLRLLGCPHIIDWESVSTVTPSLVGLTVKPARHRHLGTGTTSASLPFLSADPSATWNLTSHSPFRLLCLCM